MTLLFQPNGKLYESFSVWCPCDCLESLDELLKEEDVLLDWSQPIYLNFTHRTIVERIEKFYSGIGGKMDKVYGDVFVCTDPPTDLGVIE